MLEHNIDHLDFDMVSTYQRPGVEFLEKHISELNVYRLIRNQQIPDQFFFDHVENFDIKVLLDVRNLGKETIQNNWRAIRSFKEMSKNNISVKYLSGLSKSKIIIRKVIEIMLLAKSVN